jgi:hypothetical protein
MPDVSRLAPPPGVAGASGTPTNIVHEALAALAHEQWCGWMAYLFSKCEPGPDGTRIIPAWAVERWSRQVETHYSGLSEEEKDSDRKEAAKMLALLERAAFRMQSQ